ncbi:unnamed protein product [Sphagnum troendelagicum]|uniref:NADH-plastoquinone oxidoreductase subunit K n=1 Tax=Sphagnum troendelagicum TaxID=128251 RepID=A0ABP0UKB4_9BRYO
MIGIHVSFSVGGSHLSKLLLRSKLLANRPLISAPIDHTSGEYYLDPMQASSVGSSQSTAQHINMQNVQNAPRHERRRRRLNVSGHYARQQSTTLRHHVNQAKPTKKDPRN